MAPWEPSDYPIKVDVLPSHIPDNWKLNLYFATKSFTTALIIIAIIVGSFILVMLYLVLKEAKKCWDVHRKIQMWKNILAKKNK